MSAVTRNVVKLDPAIDQMEAAISFVKKKGARRKLGEGCYGAVWGSNEGKRGAGNRVYKICNTSSNRRAYLRYAEECVTTLKGNTHVPRIFSITEFNSADLNMGGLNVTVLCMEKLVPIGPQNGNPLQGCACVVTPAQREMLNLMSNTARKASGKPASMDEDMYNVMEVISNIYRHGDTCVDLHSANVMMRGDTIVVTDPLS